ncbi:MAG: DUF4097 family beta strand repeat-containing protein [Gemmatimonadota bacterium]|jgi:hypothetical protein
MIHVLLLGALLAQDVPADTAVDVRQGDRLVVEGLSGEVTITPGDEGRVRVISDSEYGVTLSRRGSVVRIEQEGRRGRSDELAIFVPRWMDVQVRGRSVDVSVTGLDGNVDIETVRGDIAVVGAGGEVEVRSVSGEISVANARAGVRASSQSDDVSLVDVSGPIEAHSGDGDITLGGVSSSSVRVETQDGDVAFMGAIQAGGQYGFYLHDGDATIALPGDTDASVRVATFDGEFESDFTIRVDRFTAGREFEFDLGDGGAEVEIEVFDGDISLARIN